MPCIAAGEDEEVVDKPLHADDFVEQVPGPFVAIHFELHAQTGEGTAELMGGIGDEALLALVGILQAAKHLVHRLGQPGDLVA